MCVKKHRMKYDERGNLIDDTDDHENDQSAEAEFARVFTKYYDEIGEYFPELLRLKELLKLGILSRIIQSCYEGQCEMVKRIENDTAFQTYLTEIKAKIGRYPTGSEEDDEKILNAISNNICKNFYCKKRHLKPYLLDWLRSNQQKALETYAKQSLIQCKAKLKFTIEKLNLHYDDEDQTDEQTLNNDTSQCFWVPAAFSSDSSRRVYGGVLINGKLEVKRGTRETVEKSKKSKTTENAFKVSKKSDEIKRKRKPSDAKVFGYRKTKSNSNKCQRVDVDGTPISDSLVAGRGVFPSGVPMNYFIHCNSRKEAMEAARDAGKGNPPEHHTENHEKKEAAHFHPVNKNGEIIKNGQHFTYGKYSKA